ncbi:MAG: hypothetical protein GY929_09010 [Actinomycetia bacterium]|nr:hypothetical protein [Actinomycetes bacterium]
MPVTIIERNGEPVGRDVTPTPEEVAEFEARIAEKIRKDRRQLNTLDMADTSAVLAELVQSVRRTQRALLELLGESDDD